MSSITMQTSQQKSQFPQRKNFFWIGIVLAVVVADQISKFLVLRYLVLNQTIVIWKFFNLYFNYNTGAAFSFLGGAGGWQGWLFEGIAIFVSFFLIAWLWQLSRWQVWLSVSLSLILGGAIGNLCDRIAYHRVIDFLDFYYAGWHWPTFNIADAAITIGGLMLIIEWLRKG